jgi:N-methylhydantoinase B/oxoprolinase/acetone carboxylase alpha subunit
VTAVEPSRTLGNTELQTVWHRLVSIADECWAATYRGAFSTIVGEALDVGCELLDARGESLAHATRSIPVFNMIMPNTVRAILARYPADEIAEGDVFVTNDPWLCAGHLPDVAVVTPVVRHGRLLAFVANVVNVSDIGGNLDRPRNRELFDEGLQIPIVRLCARGRRVDEVWELILRNVRTPDEVEGDLVAMIAANEGAAAAVAGLAERDGLDLGLVADAIGDRAEAAMRAAIEAIPNGAYTASWTADGFDTPLELSVVVTVVGDRLTVAFPDAPAQVETGAFNCTLSYTRGHVNYVLKCLLAPDVPTSERCFRPIEVEAPVRSVFNCERPAAVDMRTRIGWQVHPLVLRALAPVLPERVIAGCGQPSLMSLDGEWADGERFQEHLMVTAGLGAGRDAAGESVSTFPSSSASGSIELLEQRSPLIVRRRGLARGSGGDGARPGGLGEEVELGLRDGDGAWFRVVIALERMRSSPYGLFGGGDGGNSRIEVRDRRSGGSTPTSERVVILRDSDESVVVATAGGGGFGSAREEEA